MGTLAKIFLPSLDWRTKALRGNFGKDFPAILGLTNKSSTWELWQRFSCHPWTDKQKLYVETLAKIFLPSLDWRTKALCGNFGKDFPAILGLTNKSSMWEHWQRFSCHPWTDEQKPSLDCWTKALCGNFGKDFPAILGLTNKSSTWELWQRFSCHPWTDEQKLYELWQRFSCHPWTDEQKLYMGTLAKIFLPSLAWRTKALHGNFGKDFPAILGLTNKSSTWELWQRFSCHPWTDEQKIFCHPWTDEWQRFSCHPWTVEQKLYVRTLAKIFLPSLDWRMAKIFLPSLDCRTKALCGNFGKDFPAILGLTNKSSMWELWQRFSYHPWQRFSCHPWTDEQKLYVGTLAKIFLPSLDWQTKALRGLNLRGNCKDFPAILGLTNKSSTWELWQRFSCHPWTDEQKLYVGTLAKIGKDFPAILGLTNKSSTWERMAKIFLPSLDCWTKALRGNFGKDFPAILGLTNKSSMWELWQRFSCHPWTDEQKLYVGTLAKIFLPSLDWRTKALRGNFGKDFPAILGLTNKSSTWELWQRFSCHPWTDEQKLYMGTLAKIFLPSLDWQTKALRGNFGKDFPAILGLTNGKDFPAILGLSNKSSMWEHWQRFSCHPWTDEQKLYVGTLAKIFLPSLDWRTKALRGNFGKDFPAILGLTNKSSMWELWQRFSCHPWTDEQKLYVGTLAKIFLPSLDWRTKALCGNFGKDFPAILGLTNGKDFPAILGLMNGKDFPAILGLIEQKLYVGTLAKIFLPSLDCRMAKIFLPSLDWRTKALCGNIGKDFPAILGLTNKSSMWELWQRFSCHPWTDEQKLYVGTLAKIFLPSLDWQTKAVRGNFGKDFPAILGLTNKSSMWELWQRFSCHPWTDEQKLYVGTLAKIFLPSLDWRTKALRGNFGKDFPAILGLTNKSSTWELWQRFSCHPWTDEWQRFSCHPWTDEQKLYVGTLAKIFLPSLDWRTKALHGNFGKDP